MTTVEYLAIAAIVYAAASEIIGLIPSLKENSVIQVVFKVLDVILHPYKKK